MNKFKVLRKEEVHLIINEIRYLQSMKRTFSTDEVAMLIRDLTERFAK